jgi:hypothetical protein
MSNRSGFDDYTGIHGNELYAAAFARIGSRQFTRRIFSPAPGLVQNQACGSVFVKPYRGRKYDPEKWKLVEGAWDHEHCTVCGFTIVDGHSLWDTGEGRCLCDACYEYYMK